MELTVKKTLIIFAIAVLMLVMGVFGFYASDSRASDPESIIDDPRPPAHQGNEGKAFVFHGGILRLM